jgi:hypothetical protein
MPSVPRELMPLVCVSLSLLASGPAQAQQADARDSVAGLRWTITNTTRVESWRFFDPPPTGGDPDYTFVANRARIGMTADWRRIEVGAAVQYVQFGGLPTTASGPGPLGTGALYYDHSRRTDSRGVYLRTLFVRVRLPRAVTVQAGRFAYTSGAESASGRPTIETVKRARLDGRLIGEFEWSLYQRSFDGVRGDVDRKDWHLTAAWFGPTQGGFEDDAGARIRGINVATTTLTLRPYAGRVPPSGAAGPSVSVPATDLSVFAFRYRDVRPVSARPDNTGLSANHVDLRIATFGASAVGSAPAGRGEVDWLAWFAGQTGSWYAERHRAWSLALEGGYRWEARWRPWVRGGHLHASGDGDPRDGRHGTFFPMLPTVRKYAMTASYAPMNIEDTFVELITRPTARVTARVDARRLRLARATDLWYAGSGASQQRGSSFGYAGRPSGGATDLGTVIEGAGDVALGRHWSVNAFIGSIDGGRVVRARFSGERLWFGYVEHVLQF